MFKKAHHYFFSESTQEEGLAAETDQVRFAVVAILVSAARTDGLFAEAEYETISNLVEKKLNLSKTKVAELLRVQESDPLLPELLKEIQTSLSVLQREQILALAWAIIGADKVVPAQEGEFATKLRSDLGLTMEQAIRARKHAEETTIEGFKEFVEASANVIEGTQAWSNKRKI